MLTRTFCHIPGVGLATERALWAAGIHTWDDLLSSDTPPVAAGRLALAADHLQRSRQAIDAGAAEFFASHLPSAEHWRLYPGTNLRPAYVDIETTGLSWPEGQITAVALYDGESARTYVRGVNLDDFPADIAAYKLLVTFNGKCFDVPFLERHFGIQLPKAHIDLRYVLSSLGYKGGLKACEKRLGLDRGELDGVDGYFAVLLWKLWERSGEPAVLDTLLAYNVADVLGLEPLLAHAVNLQLAKTPFAELSLDIPEPKPNPYRASQRVLEEVRQSWGEGKLF